MEEWRKLRKSAVENRRERIKAAERTSSTKLEDNAVATTSQSSVSPVPSPFSAVESSSGSYQPSSDSNITYSDTPPIFTQPVSRIASTLTPALQNVSYSNPGTTSTPQYAILTPVPITLPSTDPVIKTSAHFNFSDFEADTSSPFDNMELKTINDMEELAHVLQPFSNHAGHVKQKPPDSSESLRNAYSTPVSIYNVDQAALSNTFDSKLKKDPQIHPHINGLTGYGLYGTGPRVKHHGINRNDGFIPYNYCLPGMPVKSENSYNYYSERTWSAGMTAGPVNTNYSLNPSSRSNSRVTSETPGITCSSIQQPGYATIQHLPLNNYGASFPSTSNSNQDQHSPGRSLSKSVPDIVQELEKELKNKQAQEAISAGRSSHTPPPRPNSFGSTGLEVSEVKESRIIRHLRVKKG